MKIAIIGLPNSGKTSVFNALTGGQAPTSTFTSGRLEPNLASVKVPDRRLEVLNDLYQPRKLTPAEVQYVDIGGFSGSENAEIPAEVLHFVGTADALLHVVRAFENEQVPHPAGSIDMRRDIDSLELELIFSDLSTVERRLERLPKEIRKLSGKEKEVRVAEEKILSRLKESLENEIPIRALSLAPEEEKLIRGFQFLSQKPILIVPNIDEAQIQSPPSLNLDQPQLAGVHLSARVEAELAELEPEDAAEFMQDLGITDSARDRVIETSYQLLGLISFLTVGEDEVRAWTIRKGTLLPEAGSVIHSDIQRGFIRGEVISYKDLVEAGGLPQARKRGTLRLEGRNYLVKDGDICHFLFNV